LKLALTASPVDLLGGDGRRTCSDFAQLAALKKPESSFHSACERRTVFASSPIVTAWSVITEALGTSQRRNTEVRLTHRWSEPDSKFQFRATLGCLARLQDALVLLGNHWFARRFAGGEWIRTSSSAPNRQRLQGFLIE
jgi:hypothetical protein